MFFVLILFWKHSTIKWMRYCYPTIVVVLRQCPEFNRLFSVCYLWTHDKLVAHYLLLYFLRFTSCLNNLAKAMWIGDLSHSVVIDIRKVNRQDSEPAQHNLDICKTDQSRFIYFFFANPKFNFVIRNYMINYINSFLALNVYLFNTWHF